MTEPRSVKEQTLDRVKWSITFRYVVLIVTLLLSLSGTIIARLWAPLLSGVLLACLILIYNLTGYLYIKINYRMITVRTARNLGLLLTLADVFIITLLIFFTGGILSPFVLMYLYTLLLMSIIAPEQPWYSRMIGVVVFILYEALLLLEYFGLVPLITVTQQGLAVYNDLGLLSFHMIFFPIALIAMAFLAADINIFLTRSNKALSDQVNDLTLVRQNLEQALTERGAAEKNLSASAKEWAETFDALGDGVSIHSGDFEILNVNETLTKLFGKPKEELIGKKCYSIFHQQDCPINGCPLEKAKLSKKRETAEYYEKSLDAWLLVTTSPILDKYDRLTKIIHVVRDISERKRQEQNLEDKVKELKEFHDLAVGRELKMIELENEVNSLLKELGQEPKYHKDNG